MKLISINDTIGFYNSDHIWLEERLLEANGEDVKIELSSPGGFVFPGLAMFNLIKNYPGHVTTHLMGLAASMASYVALAGDTRTSEKTGVFMLHEVSIGVRGTSDDMFSAGKLAKGLTNLLAKVYSEKSGISLKDIKEMMKAETWLFGDEIKKAGFVQEITNTDKTDTKEDAIAFAKLQFEESINLMAKNNCENINKAVALLETENIEQPIENRIVNKPATGAGKNKSEVAMNIATLKAEHPDLYNQVFQAGFQSGVNEELERVKAHMVWIDDAPEAVKINILENKSCTQSILSGYNKAALNKADINNRKADNPDDIQTPENNREEDEEKTIEDNVNEILKWSKKGVKNNG
jgi:ATP-dependent protease ClpP protease subunit